MTHRTHTTLPLLGCSALALAVACGDAGDPGAVPCDAALEGGELVITEILPDPAGADAGREWFEIYNASGQGVRLHNLTLAYAKDADASGRTHVVDAPNIELPPGSYYVLGGVVDSARPEYVNYGFADALGAFDNKQGILQLQCGEALVDEARYSLGEAGGEGASWGLDGELAPDATVNDMLVNWCLAITAFADDMMGTPGSANSLCIPPDLDTSGKCTIPDSGGELRDVNFAQPGDVIITEYMADPGGSDEGLEPQDAEWFEVYVAADIDLNGLVFGAVSDVAGATEETIKELGKPTGKDIDLTFDVEGECEPVAAGTYLLFARELDPGANGMLPEADYKFSFDLLNSDGSGLFVGTPNTKGGADAFDLVVHEGVADGASYALDPEALDLAANNDLDNWCTATPNLAYGLGGAGTPGAPNPACQSDLCLEGEMARPINALVPGDLIVTELMADPDVIPDGDGEWLEVYVTRDVDLHGLMLRRDDGEPSEPLGTPYCLPVTAGEHLVFANNLDPDTNGGVTAQFELPFSLTNSDTTVALLVRGDDDDNALLDEVHYDSSTSGAARQLSIDKLDITENDDDGNWCAAVDPYHESNLGTPGAMNVLCMDEPPPPDGDTCDDDGMDREPIPPVAGDLVITEFMANPDVVPDSDGEWFELRVAADGPIDLNGVEFAREEAGLADPEKTINDPQCLTVMPGDVLLFARKADPMVNGALPEVDFTFSFGLNNSDKGLFVGHDGALIDGVTYQSTDAGVSRSLAPGNGAADNDDGDGPPWCDATIPYNADNLGTPGLENPQCG